MNKHRNNSKKKFTVYARKVLGDKWKGKRILVWFEDEARVGQQGTITRMWARRGTRPRALKQQEFESAFVLASVCPETGASEALVMPRVNTEAMNTHLAFLSKRLSAQEHAVLVCDGAAWHRSKKLEVPENITLLLLPPYSPELNPVEQIWQWLRQRFWSNRVFRDYEDIVQACCDAWNVLAAQPQCISSITKRTWANLNI